MTKRRGNGEGSIFLRGDGIWTATINIGYDERGKRRRRTVYGKTKREVQEKLTSLQGESAAGTLAAPQRVTVAQFLASWLEDSVRLTLRRASYISYEGVIRNHINARIGGVVLTKLSAVQVQGLYSAMERAGASPRLRQLAHAVLHKALNQAIKWGLISRNACAAVDKPRVPRKEMKVLGPDQVAALLKASKGDRFQALYILAVTTGLRQGEMLALQWENIDLKGATLSVVNTLLEHSGKLELGEPKSNKGRRMVTLPALTVAALRAHRIRMLAEGHHGSWVFCDTSGGPVRKSNLVRRHFKPLLVKAGLPAIRFHDLRHTAATLLLMQGVHAKVVQERLGHSQISMTLDTYSHVLPSMQLEAAEKLDILFSSFGT